MTRVRPKFFSSKYMYVFAVAGGVLIGILMIIAVMANSSIENSDLGESEKNNTNSEQFSMPTQDNNEPKDESPSVNQGSRDYSEASYYNEQAEKHRRTAEELRRCSYVNSAAYSDYKYDKSVANTKLFDTQLTALMNDLDDGKISLAEYDMYKKIFYEQYDNTVSGLFSIYTSAIKNQGCEPNITTPPTPLS